MVTKQPINYRKLSNELNEIIDKLQNADLDIDESLKLYERGMKIVEELETYLKTAENQVNKIKKKFGA